MNFKGQGALEYLLIIGGAIVVAAIVITILMGGAGPTKCSAQDNLADALCSKLSESKCGGTSGEAPTSTCQISDCAWNTDGYCEAATTRSTNCFPC